MIMLKNKLKKIISSLLFITVLSGSAVMADEYDYSDNETNSEYSEETTEKYDQNPNFVLGGGYIFHSFSGGDDFRKGGQYGFSGDIDEIKMAGGLQFYGEYFITPMISAGVKFQNMGGGVTYTSSSTEVERVVTIRNLMAYGNISTPVGDSGYARLGGTLGVGSSTYEYDLTCKIKNSNGVCPSSDSNETASGTVFQAGAYVDWGADASGGRLGYNYMAASYSDIDGSTPKGSGGQFYIDYRYAF